MQIEEFKIAFEAFDEDGEVSNTCALRSEIRDDRVSLV